MKQECTPLKLMIAGAAAAVAFVITAPSASAQTTSTSTATSTSTSAGVLSTSIDAATRKPRATATPEMIDEAIQRSKARSDKLRTTGTPEQFGSEEPFTFVPGR